HVAQAANGVMQEQPDGGSIIMIGSISGTRPSPGTAAYGAAKAGLHHLVTSLAIEWAPKVRVNTVVPGFVATDASLPHFGDAGAGRPPLFMIGQPMDASGFGTLASHFPDRTVITYDPRGLGRSTRKDGRVDNAPTVQAQDVHAIVEALGAGPVEMFASSGGAV